MTMSGLYDLISLAENSSLADAIREDDLLFPLIETVHVIAISLVVGSISILDLRLLGVASLDRPVGRLTQGILPLTWCAFVVAAVSGSLLFISHAGKYLENWFFLFKMVLIAAAGLNMAVFHLITGKGLHQWGNKPRPPLSARFAGALSLLFWVSIVACGRWIGFTMPAE
jgi:hypothetical protein